ncbi:hypothetical protein EVAR_28022_1 [Eumeta japonica]|uniref:Uncharacterized protein n=1 Tax=Eumeta variegata TaxID=151549 RepID=A0A4C1WB82_EUMVA|nr:hypothetical protein EVAR_28022_1 [Eumeta japonica]
MLIQCAHTKIVPVELYGPEGSMKVHALLDEGSTVTLIDEQPAASLTQLGWVLHGCCSSLSRPINTVHHLRPSDASDIELISLNGISKLNPSAWLRVNRATIQKGARVAR